MRVAFPDLGQSGWMGGAVYLHNLLFALHSLEDKPIAPLVLAGNHSDPKILAMYKPFAEVVQMPLFDEKSFSWTFHKIQRRLLRADPLMEYLLKRQQVEVVSHYSCRTRTSGQLRSICWIPDFQHLHLPEMYSDKYLHKCDKIYQSQLENCDLAIVSSEDAKKDLISFAPLQAGKARVLHFVAQPAKDLCNNLRGSEIENKYNFRGKFFFLPNQFWKHKNHMTAFEAVNILKQRGLNVLILCSGQLGDFRNVKHVEHLQNFIRESNLDSNIRLLGVIDYKDMCFLMRNSISVLNPSLFEGWSTTVEEAKSLGKNTIISDIPVHHEQAPAQSRYFNPHDPEELATILAEYWQNSNGGPDISLEQVASEQLESRTRAFAKRYVEIAYDARNTVR